MDKNMNTHHDNPTQCLEKIIESTSAMFNESVDIIKLTNWDVYNDCKGNNDTRKRKKKWRHMILR